MVTKHLAWSPNLCHVRAESHVCAAEYEVDFITFFTKLANLGAKFDGNKYLYPITLELPKIK